MLKYPTAQALSNSSEHITSPSAAHHSLPASHPRRRQPHQPQKAEANVLLLPKTTHLHLHLPRRASGASPTVLPMAQSGHHQAAPGRTRSRRSPPLSRTSLQMAPSSSKRKRTPRSSTVSSCGLTVARPSTRWTSFGLSARRNYSTTMSVTCEYIPSLISDPISHLVRYGPYPRRQVDRRTMIFNAH